MVPGLDAIDLTGVVAGGGEVGLEGGHVVGHPLSRIGEPFIVETSSVGKRTQATCRAYAAEVNDTPASVTSVR